MAPPNVWLPQMYGSPKCMAPLNVWLIQMYGSTNCMASQCDAPQYMKNYLYQTLGVATIYEEAQHSEWPKVFWGHTIGGYLQGITLYPFWIQYTPHPY